MPFNKKYIRNFCVIAHIDHGKSTICDRILEKTGAVEKRNLSAQMLDDMELEQVNDLIAAWKEQIQPWYVETMNEIRGVAKQSMEDANSDKGND